jgi:hypothetical protein
MVHNKFVMGPLDEFSLNVRISVTSGAILISTISIEKYVEGSRMGDGQGSTGLYSSI